MYAVPGGSRGGLLHPSTRATHPADQEGGSGSGGVVVDSDGPLSDVADSVRVAHTVLLRGFDGFPGVADVWSETSVWATPSVCEPASEDPMTTATAVRPTPPRFSADDCRLEEFAALVDRRTDLADYPYASGVEQNVLVYDAGSLRTAIDDPAGRLKMEAELVRALTDGPGVVAFQRAFPDVEGRRPGHRDLRADHRRRENPAAGTTTTSPPPAPTTGSGTPWRSWPSATPATFVDYYGNDLLALVEPGLARSGVPGDLAGQCGPSRRQGTGPAPRLPPRLSVQRGRGWLPRARALCSPPC